MKGGAQAEARRRGVVNLGEVPRLLLRRGPPVLDLRCWRRLRKFGEDLAIVAHQRYGTACGADDLLEEPFEIIDVDGERDHTVECAVGGQQWARNAEGDSAIPPTNVRSTDEERHSARRERLEVVSVG